MGHVCVPELTTLIKEVEYAHDLILKPRDEDVQEQADEGEGRRIPSGHLEGAPAGQGRWYLLDLLSEPLLDYLPAALGVPDSQPF